MRRFITILLALLVALPMVLAPSSGAAQDARREGWGKGLDYDLERAREAMTRGAASVDAPPADVAKYMANRPLGWRHSTEPVTLEQPDGSTFQARGLEIEEGGGQATLDGYLVTRADDGWWRYGVRQGNGRIRATEVAVGRGKAPAETHSSQMPEAFRSQIAQFEKYAGQLRQYMLASNTAQSRAAAAAGEPVVFKIPALMYAVNNADPDSGDFQADDFQEGNTPEYFEKQLSGIRTSETGTVTEMYLEQSFGNMVLEIDVYGPYEGALSQIPCFFGTDGAPITGDQLGLGGGGSRGMAQEAVRLADPDVDFSQYDNNGDGFADFLTILHSGADAAATGNPCQVWSHYFGSVVGEPTTVTDDGVLIGPVLTIPEIDLQIGVTAHEIMHALGEPDYYGTAGTAGTGDWDLGAGGSWSGIPAQTNPVHFNPVMKINFGWVQPKLIEATSLGEALRPRASYPDLLMVPLKIAKAGSEGADLCDQGPVGIPHQNNRFYTEDGDCLVEGFLIENVNAASAAWNNQCAFDPADFDRQLYGSGLMVWHWDFTNWEQLGNNNLLRPMLDIEEFDRRDEQQDVGTNRTRAQPLDAFWGDPVGISGATQVVPEGGAIEPPPDSPWTVTGVPGGGLEGTEAQPIPEWEAADAPEGTGMVVTLEWTVPTDDWDLYVDKEVDGEWVEVAPSASGAPQTSEQVTIFDFAAGEKFRARAYNWLGPTSPQAEVAVDYSTAGLTQLGPAGSRNNDLEQTGWQITNIRPNEYNGLAHQAALPRTPITLDLIKHDDTTVDVSGDFLHNKTDAVTPLIAGQPTTLSTNVYNHGGAAVQGATFELYDADPATGATPLFSRTIDLGGYARTQVEFPFTPALGENDLYVVASAPGDLVAGNNVVHTELTAYAGGSQVLIVDNDFGWTFEESYEAVFNALGVTYDIVEGEADTDVLKKYDAVVWITTTVSGQQGVLSDDAQAYIAEYLDGGGKLWMATTRVGGYLSVDEDDGGNPEWLAGYFGIEIAQNLLNSPGTMTGLGGPVGGEREIELIYMDGRPYLDYGHVPEEGVKGTATALFTHDRIPEDEREAGNTVVATSVEGEGGFRTVFALPITMVKDASEQLALTTEVLDFFGIPTGAPKSQGLQVRFNRFQHVQDGEPWPVVVGAVGAAGVESVQLVYRPYGSKDWLTLGLRQAAPGLYEGTIPADQIGTNGLEYFVQARVGGTTVQVDGGEDLPNVASAPYGDPVKNADYCLLGAGGTTTTGTGTGTATTTGTTTGTGTGTDTGTVGATGGAPPTPETGGGLAVVGLALVIAAVVSLRRRG